MPESARTLEFVKGSLDLRGTAVCGILNVTDDSFSDGGLYYGDTGKAVDRVDQMVDEGADMIDIGGESSRPGAKPVSADEECGRVMPVMEKVAGRLGVPVSIDTWKAQVASRALQAGASIVNDITGLRGDPDMAEVVSSSGAGIVLMHMQGNPQNMQRAPHYDDVIAEIKQFLRAAVDRAVSAGVDRNKIMVDPGIGFGKKAEHNLEIIRKLDEFKTLGLPVLIGVSRKSVIGHVLGLPVEERLEGTAALVACSVLNGADIVRVHDVKFMRRVADMVDAVKMGA